MDKELFMLLDGEGEEVAEETPTTDQAEETPGDTPAEEGGSSDEEAGEETPAAPGM